MPRKIMTTSPLDVIAAGGRLGVWAGTRLTPSRSNSAETGCDGSRKIIANVVMRFGRNLTRVAGDVAFVRSALRTVLLVDALTSFESAVNPQELLDSCDHTGYTHTHNGHICLS